MQEGHEADDGRDGHGDRHETGDIAGLDTNIHKGQEDEQRVRRREDAQRGDVYRHIVDHGRRHVQPEEGQQRRANLAHGEQGHAVPQQIDEQRPAKGHDEQSVTKRIDRLEQMVKDHTTGVANYTSEITQILSLELIQRQLLANK